MVDMGRLLGDKHKKLYAISGIFENQNIKKYISYYKDYQVLVSFVKYWAKSRGVYGKAYGYMGGISWSLMIAYYLRKNGSKSYVHVLHIENDAQRFARILADFFKFYAAWNWLDPISLIDVEFVHQVAKDYIQKSPIMVLQTVFPYQNTTKNVSEPYKNIIIEEIKRAAQILASSSSDSYSVYESLCAKIDLRDVTQHAHLAFKIEYNHEDDLNHLNTLVKAKCQKLVTNVQRLCTSVDVRVYPCLFLDENKTPQSSFKRCAYFLIDLFEKETFDWNKKSKIADFCHEFIDGIKGLSHVSDYSITLVEKY